MERQEKEEGSGAEEEAKEKKKKKQAMRGLTPAILGPAGLYSIYISDLAIFSSQGSSVKRATKVGRGRGLRVRRKEGRRRVKKGHKSAVT